MGEVRSDDPQESDYQFRDNNATRLDETRHSKLITQPVAIFFAPLIEEETGDWQFDVMRAAEFLSSWLPLKEGRRTKSFNGCPNR